MADALKSENLDGSCENRRNYLGLEAALIRLAVEWRIARLIV
ncbi:hypothetical protein [Croceicoccus pelagius]|nr:hypothetical protein [Croceicoccus pelagius]